MTAATENWYNPYMLIKGQAFFLIQQWGGVGGYVALCSGILLRSLCGGPGWGAKQ